MHDPRHCDDYINDPEAPACLRAFLEFNRRPAIKKRGPSPKLFATMAKDVMGGHFTGEWKGDAPDFRPAPLRAGQLVRVVMASRMGDVGITPDLEAEHGYVARVSVADLMGFGAEIDAVEVAQ